MNIFSYALRIFFRQIKSTEIIILLVSTTLAVAALTSVGFLTDRMSKSVDRQANEILAADVRLRTPDPIPQFWEDTAKRYGLKTAETQTFPSVVFNGNQSALATIKAVTQNYPLRGKIRIAKELYANEFEIEDIPEQGKVWVDGTLISRLNVNIGDNISVGQTDLTISAVLKYRPDQSIGFASLAPSLLINIKDIPSTGLVVEGSRVRNAFLVAGEEDSLDKFYNIIAPTMPESTRIRNREESLERTQNTADRAQRFLSLTAVISLLLSAVAIAMASRQFAYRRMDMVALMKSLGARQSFVISITCIHIFLVGILGVIFGSAMGFTIEKILIQIVGDLFAAQLPNPSLKPILLGSGAAIILLSGFTLPSLIQLRNTSPLRVLRNDITPPSLSVFFISGCSLLTLGLLLYYILEDGWMLITVFTGLLVVSGSLYLIALGLVMLMSKLRGQAGAAWRYGLANISKKGSKSVIQIVAFGLGLTVLLLLTFVRTDLIRGWQKTLDEDAPNYFLINIQTDQRQLINNLLLSANLEELTFVPLVRARMTKINNQDVKTYKFPDEEGRWMANREANLTWATELSSSNHLVKGEWWPKNYSGVPLVSLEEEAAIEMGVDIGDQLNFVVAGLEIETIVSNMREVNWDSFQPNFFMVLTPGALDDFPRTYVASTRVEEHQKSVLHDITRNYPTVSIIDLNSILQQVKNIIDKASLAIQVVFLFTLAAGIAVLFAVVESTVDERRFEGAILKTLGLNRRTIMLGMLVEYTALGFVAGLLAACGASILAWLISVYFFEIDYDFNIVIWVYGLLSGIFLVSLSGLLATKKAITVSPLHTLRQGP